MSVRWALYGRGEEVFGAWNLFQDSSEKMSTVSFHRPVQGSPLCSDIAECKQDTLLFWVSCPGPGPPSQPGIQPALFPGPDA